MFISFSFTSPGPFPLLFRHAYVSAEAVDPEIFPKIGGLCRRREAVDGLLFSIHLRRLRQSRFVSFHPNWRSAITFVSIGRRREASSLLPPKVFVNCMHGSDESSAESNCTALNAKQIGIGFHRCAIRMQLTTERILNADTRISGN